MVTLIIHGSVRWPQEHTESPQTGHHYYGVNNENANANNNNKTKDAKEQKYE